MMSPILAVVMLVSLPAYELIKWLYRDYNCTWTLQEWDRSEEGNQQTPLPVAGGLRVRSGIRMSDHTPVDDPLECPECQSRGFTVGHSIPSAAMVEAASIIDVLQREAHRAPRPVTRDCLIAFIEIIYQHSPIMGGINRRCVSVETHSHAQTMNESGR